MAGAYGSSTYGPLWHPEKPSYSQSLLEKGRYPWFTMLMTPAEGHPCSFHLCPQNSQPFAFNAGGRNQATICKYLGKSCASLVGMSGQGEAVFSTGIPYTHPLGEGTPYSHLSFLNLFFDLKYIYWILPTTRW